MALFKKISPYLLIILLSIFSILPLLKTGFFPIHDNTQVQRVYEMAKSLSLGMFPVRWVSDLGYGLGYPIFNFYAPLAYYFGAIFILFGLDALIATKIMIIFGILFSGISMYLLSKEFWGKMGGIISALLYIYFPYHAVNIYVRGAVSELFAYAFIPLAFFGFYKLHKENKYRYVFISVIGFSAIILSHNLTAMMVVPFLIIELIILGVLNYKKQNNKNTLYLIYAFLLGIFVSSFYFIPALLEMGNTNVASTIGKAADYKDHFVCLNQLWYSQWGFGGSTKTCSDGLSFMLSRTTIFISLITIIGFILSFSLKRKISKKAKYLFLMLVTGVVISIFLMLPQSSFIWQSNPFMKYFQYPWRYLNMVGFFTAFLSGAIIMVSRQFIKNKSILIIETLVIAILITSINVKFFKPQKVLNLTASDYTNEVSLKWTTSRISDEYLPKEVIKPKTKEEALKNKPIFSFEETPIQKTANALSIASILIAILGIILTRKKK